jgi:hypothetical protein
MAAAGKASERQAEFRHVHGLPGGVQLIQSGLDLLLLSVVKPGFGRESGLRKAVKVAVGRPEQKPNSNFRGHSSKQRAC